MKSIDSAASRSRAVAGGLAVAVCCLWQVTAQAGPGGELDPSFAQNGRLVLDSTAAYAVAVNQQPQDGRLVVAGTVSDGPGIGDFVVLRLLIDGAPDPGFASAGIATIDLVDRDHYLTSLALHPDGRIIVGGTSGNGWDWSHFTLARLDTDGRLDPDFGGNGRVTLDPGGWAQVLTGIVAETDGRIVLAGHTWVNDDYDIVLARLNPDGTSDASFGAYPGAGITVVDSGLEDASAALIRQADDKYVVCGLSYRNATEPNGSMLAVRINPDGSPDAGFGVGGIWRHEPVSGYSSAQDCIVLPDGSLLLAGATGDSSRATPTVAHLTSDGRLDTRYWDSGFSRIDVGANAGIQSIVAVDDRSIAMAGTINEADGPGGLLPGDVFVALLNLESGQLDPDFGNNGMVIVDTGDREIPAESAARGLIRQGDGKLAVVGSAVRPGGMNPVPAMLVARVAPDGNANSGFIGFKGPSVVAEETIGAVEVAVRRTGGSAGAVSVNYDTVPYTGTSPGSFVRTSGTLTWGDGDFEPRLISVAIVDDSTFDPDNAFRIVLSGSAVALASSEISVFISDNEPRPGRPGNEPNSGGGAPDPWWLGLIAGAGVARYRREPRGSVARRSR